MDCGDTQLPVLNSSTGLNQTEPIDKNNTTLNKPQEIFKLEDDYEFENYDGKRAALAKKIKEGIIVRCDKFRNKKVAVLRYKMRQARINQQNETRSVAVFLLGVVGCITCSTVEVGSGFGFFSQDFDMVLAKQRTQIENPTVTDPKQISKLTDKKRSGSSFEAHLKKCDPQAIPKDSMYINNSGTKNSSQFKNKTAHILKTKTTAAMMIVAGGIPMAFLGNPYLRSFCDLTAGLSNACLGISPGECVWGANSIKTHITEKMMPLLDDDIRLCATDAKNFTGGLPNRYNAFSMDVTVRFN